MRGMLASTQPVEDHVHPARVFVEHFGATVRPHLRKPLHHRYSAMAPKRLHLTNAAIALAGLVVCVLTLVHAGGLHDAPRTILTLALASLTGGLLVQLANATYLTFHETFLVLGFVVLDPTDAWFAAAATALWFLLRRPASWLGGLGDCVTVIIDASLGLAAVVIVRDVLAAADAPPLVVLLACVAIGPIAMNLGALVAQLPYIAFVDADVRAVIAPITVRDVIDAMTMMLAAQAPTIVLAAAASEAAWWLPSLLLAPLLHSWWAAESTARLAEARQQARTDPLTGIANRLGFSGVVAPRLGRDCGSVAFALGDVDNFKTINDTRGHAAGDEVLCTVAGILRAEAGSGDFVVARYGGEEFLVAQFGATGAELAGWADRVRLAIREALAEHGSGISIGVTDWSGTGDTLEAAVGRADAAMYHAKLEGKDRVRVFETDVAERLAA
ncbi:MAG: diguanylate cyclase/phosphodiesterase [Thermoleophilia bacterium]|nr:diguanylate cyclase/phosphodiesterase [Thermoleophilia bacterium]